ncbi:MAG: DUF3160 domain-containing protein [Edafosvirus sp.]|uniref:DUF3160 domain-containing protein n=1 Tax=Edafosvirus sp. TaxID=2487765 RepID=A0A3G4ZS16_9VIRU|nr:MAG: DUF3160 domain-containing protein [Edafosvirus sp.]
MINNKLIIQILIYLRKIEQLTFYRSFNIFAYNKLKMAHIGEIKFMDLVQMDTVAFNAEQERKQTEYKREHGSEAFYKIMYRDRKHHPLKATRNVSYNLTEDEKKELCSKGFLMKETKDMTFEQVYLSLYNNDMPVVITSDSVLSAFHKYYDNWLKQLELEKLINKMNVLCEDIAKSLEKVEVKTEYATKILKFIELVVNVPRVLLNLSRKLPVTTKKIKYDFANTVPKEEFDCKKYEHVKEMDWQKNKERIEKIFEEEKKSGFTILKEIGWNDPKLRIIMKFYDIKMYDSWFMDYVNRSPKLNTQYHQFECADCYVKPVLKYNTIEEFDDIVMSVIKNEDIQLKFGDELITNIVGTMFKPRGHYTESSELQKYFMAFKWLSMFTFNLKKIIKNDVEILPLNSLAFCVTLTKLVKSDMIAEFTNVIETIMGAPSGYTVPSFASLINKHVTHNLSKTSLAQPLGVATDDIDLLCEQKSIESLYRTIEPVLKHNEMSIISQGISFDYTVLNHMVDSKFYLDNGKQYMRKYPSVRDILATLFNNKSVVLPECDYVKQIEKVSKMCDDYKFNDSVYDHELKMLRALCADQEKMKTIGWWPFGTDSWNKKLANTQTGHYSEVRHDNVLYVKEYTGCCTECEYPDLLVEPVPTFWNEFLALIIKMRTLDSENYKLEYFEKAIRNIIEYLQCQLEGKPINPELVEKLKSIAHYEHRGSGGPSYGGWYCDLLKNPFTFKPEVSTIFTGVPDDRDTGGVIHLGTGPVRLLYVLSRNPHDGETKVFLGPVYSSYEFKTPYTVRHNDEDWMKEYTKYKPLDF